MLLIHRLSYGPALTRNTEESTLECRSREVVSHQEKGEIDADTLTKNILLLTYILIKISCTVTGSLAWRVGQTFYCGL